jgi:hypothetical protein
MAMEAGPLKIHKDIEKDVLMVNQVTKGKLGAAQLQIVLNLKPVRALAKKILDDKVTEISGDRQRFAHPKAVAKLTNRLAIRGICGFSLFSAKSPLAALNQDPAALAKKAGAAAGAKYARVNKIVEAYKKDKLKKFGGFDGLKKKIALHRESESNKLLASGIPPAIVNAKKERQKSEDSWVIAEAARQLGLEEVKHEETDEKEDKDEASGFSYSKMYPRNASAGWNPFKKKKKMSIQQRMDAAAARTEAAQAESDARAAEQEAKDAEDALKDGGTIPPPDDGGDGSAPPADGPPPSSASGLDALANLKRLRKVARMKRYHAHHAKRRYHKAMKAGMMGASAAETAASSAVPGGPATMAVAKFAYKKGGKKHAQSAVKLAKARNGDPAAIASIKKTNAAAKKGDPNAKAEMKRLQTVNHLAKKAESRYTTLLRSGVAGMKQYSTKASGPQTSGERQKTIEGMYGDTLSSGCS